MHLSSILLGSLCAHLVAVSESLSAPDRRLSSRLNVASVVAAPESSLFEDAVANKPSALLLYDDEGYPQLGSIAKVLPENTFDVDTPTSLLYFGIDAAAVVVTMGFLNTVVHSDLYQHLSIWQQGAMVLPLQVLTGFAMWCMWCIGHDAGHSVISKEKWVNHLVGEIAHSIFCLTPFVPWQLSHRRHHINHNHLTRDYSHQWFVREEADQLEWWIKAAYKIRNFQLPFLYFVYLAGGIPDGGHVWLYGRLWEGQPAGSKARGMVSVSISLMTSLLLWSSLGTSDFVVVCLVPWLIMSFWLFMVTYLQHHSADGKPYTDDTFSFVKGAFETVDRDYGTWVNKLSHHMMDGHVIHHLFFEKVPHYRLEAATVALQEALAKEGKLDMYKQIDTPNFSQEIVKQFDKNWFFINEDQVVRKE